VIIFSLIKMKSLHLATTIASTFISVLSIFAVVDINNEVKAIVVAGDPNNYVVKPGTGYDGVTFLASINSSINPIDNTAIFNDEFCSGSLLSTGLHILTAAHCLTSLPEDVNFAGIPGQFNTLFTLVGFESPEQPVVINASEFYIHPDWNGDYFNGNDLAIIKLSEQAPATADRYDIYRATDELDQVVTKVGYGDSGNGNTGATIRDFIKRSGQNIYELPLGKLGDAISWTIPNAARNQVLGYDFDNGLVANDLFGYFGIPNTGLGLNEVNAFKGDSGGPGFINNLIAGISSFNAETRVVPSDIFSGLNGSFGEFSFDTRVSSYASYIDDVLAGKIEATYIDPAYKVPEPSTILGSILALGAFAINSCLRRTAKTTK
jgi:secreted trypsin-like serine protease